MSNHLYGTPAQQEYQRQILAGIDQTGAVVITYNVLPEIFGAEVDPFTQDALVLSGHSPATTIRDRITRFCTENHLTCTDHWPRQMQFWRDPAANVVE